MQKHFSVMLCRNIHCTSQTVNFFRACKKFIQSNFTFTLFIRQNEISSQSCIQNPVEHLRWSFFEKIVNGFQKLTIFAESSIVDVGLGCEYASGSLAFMNSLKLTLIKIVEVYMNIHHQFGISRQVGLFFQQHIHYNITIKVKIKFLNDVMTERTKKS